MRRRRAARGSIEPLSGERIEPSGQHAHPDQPSTRKTVRAPSLVRELWKKPALRSLLAALLAARMTRPWGERCPFDIECYPGVPYHRHMVWKVALYAGARLIPYTGEALRNAGRPKLRLVWPDATATAGLVSPPEWWWDGALNARADDESKRKVERVFAQAFGYEVAVDPTTYQGVCVAKSDRLNGAHDGRLVACPIAEADPELSYQVLVDNRVDRGTVLDFRVPVVGGEIPFVYRKYRPLSDRFGNANEKVAFAQPAQVFSDDERKKLCGVALGMGVELGGELDVLRDAKDGRLYVVDVNWTSWGPPRPMSLTDSLKAVRAYAAALTQRADRAAVAD